MKTNTNKQSSWFRTDKDIKFENSFKFWFALMWQNHYIQLFVLVFGFTIVELFKIKELKDIILDNYYDEGALGATFASAALAIPLIVSLVIAYKGFYQYFNDQKLGKSR